MAEPYAIRIFVPQGIPENIIIVERFNWTGIGLKFSRRQWQEASKRKEFDKPGVYFLLGEIDNDLPQIYIGQAEILRARINAHDRLKEFWDWGYAFTSSNDSLNKGHLAWLESTLIERARLKHQSHLLHLTNSQNPNLSPLSEADKSDMQAFLTEILLILPIMGLRILEEKEIVIPNLLPQVDNTRELIDTIVVPAQEEGFNRVFLGENSWWAIRIASHMLDKLKYIAAYQVSPISAITHIAPIKLIESFGNEGKYKVIFSEKASEVKNIPRGNVSKGTMQGPRYTSLAKLKVAKTISEL